MKIFQNKLFKLFSNKVINDMITINHYLFE